MSGRRSSRAIASVWRVFTFWMPPSARSAKARLRRIGQVVSEVRIGAEVGEGRRLAASARATLCLGRLLQACLLRRRRAPPGPCGFGRPRVQADRRSCRTTACATSASRPGIEVPAGFSTRIVQRSGTRAHTAIEDEQRRQARITTISADLSRGVEAGAWRGSRRPTAAGTSTNSAHGAQRHHRAARPRPSPAGPRARSRAAPAEHRGKGDPTARCRRHRCCAKSATVPDGDREQQAERRRRNSATKPIGKPRRGGVDICRLLRRLFLHHVVGPASDR